MGSIFISIAACKELFLVQTIKSAIANASNPDDIYFGICNTVIDDEDFLNDPVFKLKNVQLVELKHNGALGTGIGRLMASLLADRDHEYFLQIDAHTLFVKGWDDILKRQYKELLEVCERPIISTSPNMWNHTDNGELFISDDPDKLIPLENFVVDKVNHTLIFSNNKNAVTETMRVKNLNYSLVGFVEGCHTEWKENEKFKEHGLIHAAFVFFKFDFLNELISDPFDPWSGDQTNISFRAGTRGYRMFTVKQATVFTKDKFDINRNLIYSYDWRKAQTSSVHKYLKTKAQKRLRKILSGEYLGFWGSPDKESIKQYESHIGFKFLDNFID